MPAGAPSYFNTLTDTRRCLPYFIIIRNGGKYVNNYFYSVFENIRRIVIDLRIGFQLRVGLRKGRDQARAVSGGTGFDVQALGFVAAVWVILGSIGIFWWFHRFTPF